MQPVSNHLPAWMQGWLTVFTTAGQIVLIIALAWVLYRLGKRLLDRACEHYDLPPELMLPLRAACRWVLGASASLLILERLGVSATVLWTAFTGFAAVGTIAFFAAWSVLSNLFCALLILVVGPFRLGDQIEILDTADTPGARGRVIDINMLYVTLQDSDAPEGMPNLLQIPNALIFQRVIRRWKGSLQPGSEHRARERVREEIIIKNS